MDITRKDWFLPLTARDTSHHHTGISFLLQDLYSIFGRFFYYFIVRIPLWGMAHAASQLKKKADLELTAAEDEKDKKRKSRKRSREGKKKVRTGQSDTRPRGGWTFHCVIMVVSGSRLHIDSGGLSRSSKCFLSEGKSFFFFLRT